MSTEYIAVLIDSGTGARDSLPMFFQSREAAEVEALHAILSGAYPWADDYAVEEC